MSPRISFHGAALGVTGSCHLVEAEGSRILLDCGLFQGSRELEEDNAEPFGFEPGEIDCVLLTHAHLDHCGRLPLLQSRGFTGDIIATAATRDLAELVLFDAAHLQKEEARYRAHSAHRQHKHAAKIEPLYTSKDVEQTLAQFGPSAHYGTRIQLAGNIHATFVDAGHILGSACVLLEIGAEGHGKRLLFSGDLGSSGRPILSDPAPPPGADVVIMETTYGERLHKALEPSIEELYEAIDATFSRGGNVLIPTFALERAQELLFYLREGIATRRLPGTMQVYLDSPMAISATEIFKRHPECYNAGTFELFRKGHDAFDLPGLHFTRTVEESMAINEIRSGAVIMAGSGMCAGGRIRHHLRRDLGRGKSSVVFVGYAARGTLARYIIDGAETVHIFGEEIPVRASIHTIGGFSAHADRDELLAWHRQTGNPEWTYLVHGEREVMERFGSELGTENVRMPALHQGFEL